MPNLDTQIGPFPLKYWLIIGFGGVGIGYLVTRNSGGTKPTASGTNPNDVARFNELNQKIMQIGIANEGVNARYAETNTVLSDLRKQLDAITTRLNQPATPTPTRPRTSVAPLLREPDVKMFDSRGMLVGYSYDNVTSRI